MQALNNVDDAGIPQGQAYNVLLYPTMLGLASELGQAPLAGDNNRLSPFSGFPALTMPAGMTNSEPQLPVGMEMLAREFDEASLIKIAYAYEKMAQPRQAPSHTPAL
jgi:Asp-tRNA(Asn)/Glu-tRNA(Gln) amidotransferase A subunit family amidase